MQHVYMLENTATKSFLPWEFNDQEPGTRFKRLHDFIILYPDKAREQLLQFCKLHYVGVFDELTGTVSFDDNHQVYDVMADFDQLDSLRRQANAGARD